MDTIQQDRIDQLIKQWKMIKPDLDTSSIEIIGRVILCYKLLEPLIQKNLNMYGLSHSDFDVLSSLRRNNGLMSPTELYTSLLITSGTITHRLKSLQKRGFITRERNYEDNRSLLVRLTVKGEEIIDKVIIGYLEYEKSLVNELNKATQKHISEALKKILNKLESDLT